MSHLMENQFSIKNKNIVITGAAGILGKKLSQSLLNSGAHLALIDKDEKTLNKLKDLKIAEDNFFEIYVTDLTKEKVVNKTIVAFKEI